MLEVISVAARLQNRMDILVFIDAILKVGSENGFENYYRGHSDSAYKLTPSIYRNGLIENEHKIFKEAIIRTPQEFLNSKSAIEKLVKMQHYGVPTRLLDITSNPLVALYFACNGNKNKNGEVIFLKIPTTHVKFYDSDTISVLANIAQQSTIDIDIFATKISAFNETDSVLRLLHTIKEEKPYFQNCINPKHLEDVFAVKVKLDNQRILKQNGAFLIFGINSNKKVPSNVPHTWITSFKIEIPFLMKDQILKELDLLGFNQSTLFPEIENQGQHLINTYKINE